MMLKGRRRMRKAYIECHDHVLDAARVSLVLVRRGQRRTVKVSCPVVRRVLIRAVQCRCSHKDNEHALT
jgi:hypothetical protein